MGYKSVKESEEWKPKSYGGEKAVVEKLNAEENCLEGIFLGSEDNVGTNKATIYKLQELKSQKIMTFWGTGVLDKHMKIVSAGRRMKLTYLGMVTPKSGGKDYHDWDVALWSD